MTRAMKEQPGLIELARRLRPRRMLMRFDGIPPKVGDLLLAERGRVAKRIIGVRPYNGSQSYAGRGYDVVLIVESIPIAEIPEGATVHGFEYLRRRRSNRPRSFRN